MTRRTIRVFVTFALTTLVVPLFADRLVGGLDVRPMCGVPPDGADHIARP
jgi:hypothetical protein